MRNNRGPRQPGGGKQTAGPRHRDGQRPKRPFRRPEAPARSDGLAERRQPNRQPPPWKSKSAKSASARGRAASGSLILRGAPRAPTSGRRETSDARRTAMPTSVQNVAVTADETGMRVDRFLEARFPGLSFSHIQRVIRKGELRVNGKRTEPKNRLEAGQTVRIPPLRLDQPKPRAPGDEADDKTREFLKSITLYEDAGRDGAQQAVRACGAGRLRHHAASRWHARRAARRARPAAAAGAPARQGHGGLSAGGQNAGSRRRRLAKTFRSRSARKIYWALVAGVPKVRARPDLDLPRQGGARRRKSSCASPSTAKRARAMR